jgi:hypothetical protein
MNHSNFWNAYLRETAAGAGFESGLDHCRAALAHQRETLARLVHALHPDSVAVLGAGYLNDIPLADLVDGQTKLFLVDWKEDAPRVGMARSILRAENGQHHCLFCKTRAGQSYCGNFSDAPGDAGVCRAFRLESAPAVACAEYVPAEEPVFVRADVTGGVASRFAAAAEKIVAACHSPKEAFLKAIKIAHSAKPGALPLADRSIELVTSSMVLSQFDVEPYNYFARQLEERFGRDEILKHADKLVPLMEQLRTHLFLAQVAAHVNEMWRIVKRTASARVFLSTELFRCHPPGGADCFFLVRDMARALETIGAHFHFEFAGRFDDTVIRKSTIGDGVSVIHSYILVPRLEGPTLASRYSH